MLLAVVDDDLDGPRRYKENLARWKADEKHCVSGSLSAADINKPSAGRNVWHSLRAFSGQITIIKSDFWDNDYIPSCSAQQIVLE